MEKPARIRGDWAIHRQLRKVGLSIGGARTNRASIYTQYEPRTWDWSTASQLGLIAIVNEAARVEALVNKNIPIHDPRITAGDPKFDAALFEQVNRERERLVEEWTKAWPNFHSRSWAMGVYGMNAIIDCNPQEAGEAVQATMAAMLIGLWTAFESLAQDTWITAVNLRPNPLASRILNRQADLGTGTQSKSISTDQIIGHSFDLTNSMGTILFRQRAVDFQQLKTIRLAYKVAFAGELDPIFESYQQELFWLETERNLFVHKGGLVDRKFIERMGNEPDMKKTEGQSLSLNGKHIAHKANVVAECSTQLIQAVDRWLVENRAVENESR